MAQHCASHDIFEKFLQNSIDNLSGKITEGVDAFMQQSVQNGKALAQVLSNQADRRELCGKQGARLDGLDREIVETKKAIADLWSAVNVLRKMVWMGAGGIALMQLLAPILVKALFS